MTRRKPPSDVSKSTGRAIQFAREYRRLSQTELCEKVGQLGVPLHQSVLARMENGDRPIRVDELFAVAAALDVAPVFLLSGDLVGEDVQVTPTKRRASWWVRSWVSGQAPLDDGEEQRRAYLDLVPDQERLARQWRQIVSLQRILAEDLAGGVSHASRTGDYAYMIDAVKDMGRELKWLREAIEQEQMRAQRAGREE